MLRQNCFFYAAGFAIGPQRMMARDLWPVEHPGQGLSKATVNDLRLQLLMREQCADWLQLDANAEHRRVGSDPRKPVWDPATKIYLPLPPPPQSSVERHRAAGVYAQSPQIRALAELLSCTIVSIDSSTLFDRVPVYAAGDSQTVRIKSWERELAPAIRGQGGSGDAPLGAQPLVVVINNGSLGADGHFDATCRSSSSV